MQNKVGDKSRDPRNLSNKVVCGWVGVEGKYFRVHKETFSGDGCLLY